MTRETVEKEKTVGWAGKDKKNTGNLSA